MFTALTFIKFFLVHTWSHHHQSFLLQSSRTLNHVSRLWLKHPTLHKHPPQVQCHFLVPQLGDDVNESWRFCSSNPKFISVLSQIKHIIKCSWSFTINDWYLKNPLCCLLALKHTNFQGYSFQKKKWAIGHMTVEVKIG